jgi:glutaredoxin-related protein
MLKMVLGALAAAEDNAGILFGSVDAESASDLSDKFEITMVPTILLLVGDSIRERLEGEVLSDPSHVTLAVQRLATLDDLPAATAVAADTETTAPDESTTTTAEEGADPKQAALNDRLERLTRADTIMVFMKGNPNKPRCGFSRQAVELLRKEEIPFGSFDILEDNDVRQGLKTFSDWPTYPQIVSIKLAITETTALVVF